MFGRVIWDKLPKCIFENLEIALFLFRQILKITRVIYTKNCPNQTCDYWLITPNQQTLCIETNIFYHRAITKQRYKITHIHKNVNLEVIFCQLLLTQQVHYSHYHCPQNLDQVS